MKKFAMLWKRCTAILCILAMLAGLAACSSSTGADTQQHDTDISSELTYTESMELDYADQFAVDYYEDGYALITISDGSQYLVIPEGKEAPSDLDESIVCIQQPVKNIYLVASAVMDMFVSIDALDTVRFSGLEESDWYIPEVQEKMASGDILYAGKYSAPDYEKILAEDCGLVIENTMISHTPEVQEELEQFGLPVLVDYSSYESNPLGRCEWVKLYGLITGKQDAAETAFEEQEAAFDQVADLDETGKTVAFFYITSNGQANVRKSGDYLPKMIEMAGGKYIFDDLGSDEDNASSTVSMQMEEFYAGAKDADYIIYNSTIDGELSSVDDLLSKSDLFADFKAVQEGNVYCTTKNLYQSSMALGTLIQDISKMLHGQTDDMTYIYKLQ